ncbi:hypothetical protein [Candidatus Nitronereus thalassa]|uniref:Uncharacterized protein n=1 Tax=Candidatus Nitronereus thalassa TaxID=3020898 RepID=A0ABU3K6Y6_9BACT|nr:hypothetical protein [Candidatus Nitronereus thalassa]MDT7042118.1 hypothetical protein [Candidatus Nitronereus thalassa]
MTLPGIQILLMEFRQELELFYKHLQLAPPYDSVEKALICLSRRLSNQSTDEQDQMAHDQTFKWKLFQEAVVESGLHKKHRGIIVGLLRSQGPDFIPETQRYLQEPFLAQK